LKQKERYRKVKRMPQYLKNISLLLFLFCGLVFFLSSCRVAKNLPENQSLLVKNNFIFPKNTPGKVREKFKGDLPKIAGQKPNIRVFGFMPARMWLYYAATHSKKLTKFKQWIIDKVGEAPAILDSALIEKGREQMETYIFNLGYFHNNVTDTVITKNKKTTVNYYVTPGPVWTIGQIELPKGHTACDSIVRENWRKSLLHTGDHFDMTNAKNERERIETLLRNYGFFTFSREYVGFDYDTFSTPGIINIKENILPPAEGQEHQQYRMNNIYIISDFSGDILNDTVKRDTLVVGEYRLIAAKWEFKKKVLLDAIAFKKDELYSKEREQKTINNFTKMGTFKFISLDYSKAKDREGNYLNCKISLTPAKKSSIGWGADIDVTDEGLFGTNANVSYQNKNLSKRADQLIIDASGGVQVRFGPEPDEKAKVQLMDITLSLGVTYYLNKFLIPFRSKIFSPNVNPKTRFSVRYTFDHRYDFDSLGNVLFLYQLHNFNAEFGYEWNKNTDNYKTSYLLNPITFDFYLLPEVGSEFTQRLDEDPILKSSFQEQIIIGPNYTFTYNNQKTPADKKYMHLRIGLETAGNVIDAAFKMASTHDQNDSAFLIGNRPFSQYFRVEVDWANFIRMTNHSLFAIRTFAGVGVPYGNSVTLPFIKQFYVGGPDDLRGFLTREIGPGSFVDTSVFDPEKGPKANDVGFFNQTGDIKLEANAEIRFDIYKWLKGAIFTDAGNVWTLNKDAVPGGNFSFTRFWSEFAVDAGPGIRLDFGFFVVRFDYGFPLRDPRRVIGQRWQFQNAVAFKNGQLQLAINYPF
jgi:outer membrane protein assembly factor BamA